MSVEMLKNCLLQRVMDILNDEKNNVEVKPDLDFGEKYEGLPRTFYLPRKDNGEIEAFGVLEDCEDNDGSIKLIFQYAVKYGHFVVRKNGGKATAGWNRRFNDTGIPIIFDVFFKEYSEEEMTVMIDIQSRGFLGSCVVKYSEGEWSFYDSENNEYPNIAWLIAGYGSMVTYRDKTLVSKMMNDFIGIIINWLTDTLEEKQNELVNGYSEEDDEDETA